MANKKNEPVDQTLLDSPESGSQPAESNYDTFVNITKAKLKAQPHHTIRLRPESKAKPGEQTVQVNGYTYQIKRGETVSVPKTVYDILVEAGEV